MVRMGVREPVLRHHSDGNHLSSSSVIFPHSREVMLVLPAPGVPLSSFDWLIGQVLLNHLTVTGQSSLFMQLCCVVSQLLQSYCAFLGDHPHPPGLKWQVSFLFRDPQDVYALDRLPSLKARHRALTVREVGKGV